MNWVDCSGPPGVGKSTLCDHFFFHRWPDYDGLPPPEEWKDFLAEVNRLVALVKDHKNCFGQPTLSAVIRMNERSLKKMATVTRINDAKPYIQTGFVQRGLGFGWRLVDMGKDLRETKGFFELMPISIGVAFLKASLTTIFERNEAREKVPATQHENRNFQVPLMVPAIEYAKEVLGARGVPTIEIDVENQSIDDARAQLVEFSQRETSTVMSDAPTLMQARELVTVRRLDIAVKYRYFRHLIDNNDPDSERVYIWHLEARKAANAMVGIGMDTGKTNATDYTDGCKHLLHSMKANGFMQRHAIPIDPDGELLGGAHRLACALALGIGTVPVERKEQYVWAPAWAPEWFVKNDINLGDFDRIREDWCQMKAQRSAA